MKKIIVLLSLFLASAACNRPPEPSPRPISYNYSHQLQIGGKTLTVEVADTVETMQQGLSSRENMTEGQGMLFNFGSNDSLSPAFWMKDMRFNLDFIWINKNKVIGITPNVLAPASAASTLPFYYPPSPVNWVLEVNAGWAAKNSIKLGDDVELNN